MGKVLLAMVLFCMVFACSYVAVVGVALMTIGTIHPTVLTITLTMIGCAVITACTAVDVLVS